MALRTNELLRSSRLNDSASPWSGNGSFTITAQTSVLPGSHAKAYSHVNDGGGTRTREQTVGTLTGAAETLYAVFENVDAVTSALYFYDVGAATGIRAVLTWSTGNVSNDIASGFSSISSGSVDLGTGPNGGQLYLVWITGTPSNPGNSRRVIVYPTGTGTNTLEAILHHVQLDESATRADTHIETFGAARAAQILNLDDFRISSSRAEGEPLIFYRRRASNKLSSTMRGNSAFARVWNWETSVLTTTEDQTLDTILYSPGLVTAVGRVLNEDTWTGSPVRGQILNPDRKWGPQSTQVRWKFGFREAFP